MKLCKYIFWFLVLLVLLIGCQPAESTQPGITTADAASEVVEMATAVVTEEPTEPWQIVKVIEIEHKPTYAAFMNDQIGATDCG